MAKHFATLGVWGVTPFGFTSATSTPFYVLLIAIADWLTGVKDYWPLVLAFAAGVGAIFAAAQITSRLAPLLAVVLFTPLAAMAHLGMEHTLHIALTLLFAWRALKFWIQRDGWLVALTPFGNDPLRKSFSPAYRRFCSPGAVCSFALAASLIVAAAVPVTLYGFVALAHGWFFLPNSVLLKGAVIGPGLFRILRLACLPCVPDALPVRPT